MAARDSSHELIRFDYVSWRRAGGGPLASQGAREAAQEAALSHAREYCQRFPGFRAVRSNYSRSAGEALSPSVLQPRGNAVAR